MRLATLTALDLADECVVDVTAMTAEAFDEAHGQRNARSHGHDFVCRHCHGPVHLAKYPTLAYWRHNAGHARGCLLADVVHGESVEHLAAKRTIVGALRQRDWHAEVERMFAADGEIVWADVYAHHPRPRPHQGPMIWEAQLSRQPHGEFVRRTDERWRAAGTATTWCTPYGADLGDLQGLVVSPDGAHVVARAWADLDHTRPLTPMPLGECVDALTRHRPTLALAQSGEYGEWLLYPPDVMSGATLNRTRRRRPGPSVDGYEDRNACTRPPVVNPAEDAADTAWTAEVRAARREAVADLTDNDDGWRRLALRYPPEPAP
jgi:hypothetical protein